MQKHVYTHMHACTYAHVHRHVYHAYMHTPMYKHMHMLTHISFQCENPGREPNLMPSRRRDFLSLLPMLGNAPDFLATMSPAHCGVVVCSGHSQILYSPIYDGKAWELVQSDPDGKSTAVWLDGSGLPLVHFLQGLQFSTTVSTKSSESSFPGLV